MNNNKYYFDNAATTPVKKNVIDVMLPYFSENYYNPSSLYSGSRKIKQDIEKARKTIAQTINAKSEELYFTSGGSEANSWAIQGFCKKRKYCIVITNKLEHHSILECCKDLYGYHIGINSDGTINFNALENDLAWCSKHYNDILVSIQLANNEIGIIQDIKSIAEIVHKYKATLHCDATQAYGHIPIDVKKIGVDLMTISGHKVGAPKGIGCLYIKEGVNIQPIIYGTQEKGLRGGTENVPYIMGFAEAVKDIDIKCSDDYIYTMREIRDYFIEQLIKHFKCYSNISYYGLPNIINVTFPQNITGEALIYLMDNSGFQISSGSACNSYTNKPSEVLKAIGLSDQEAMRTIRISLPELSIWNSGLLYDLIIDNAKKIIDKFIEELSLHLKIFESET